MLAEHDLLIMPKSFLGELLDLLGSIHDLLLHVFLLSHAARVVFVNIGYSGTWQLDFLGRSF